jgi:hypothetical protein
MTMMIRCPFCLNFFFFFAYFAWFFFFFFAHFACCLNFFFFFFAFVCVSQSHVMKAPHITGIFFWVTEEDLRHKTEIPVAMTRGYEEYMECYHLKCVYNPSYGLLSLQKYFSVVTPKLGSFYTTEKIFFVPKKTFINRLCLPKILPVVKISFKSLDKNACWIWTTSFLRFYNANKPFLHILDWWIFSCIINRRNWFIKSTPDPDPERKLGHPQNFARASTGCRGHQLVRTGLNVYNPYFLRCLTIFGDFVNNQSCSNFFA